MKSNLDVTKLMKAEVHAIIHQEDFLEYWAYSARPAKGLLYITHNNHEFISGHVRMRGKDEGRYPFHYLEMIDNLFGKESNTIEVCSRSVHRGDGNCFTVDINPDCLPCLVSDGQELNEVESNRFNRWRCDPPYNKDTARQMYGTDVPNFYRLLEAGARVCKTGSLMFLLLGPTNYQVHPENIKRIGLIFITVVPNNEVRCLNIYIKLEDKQARLL